MSTQQILASNPELAALTTARYADATGFMGDMRDALLRGRMSDRQINAAVKAVKRDAERDAKRAQWDAQRDQKLAAGVSVPTGRVVINGTVKRVKEEIDPFCRYGTTKYRLIIESPDGWTVMGTMPRSLEPTNYSLDEWDAFLASLVGRQVQLTGTVKPSERDATFGFYSRPAKASWIEPETVAPVTPAVVIGYGQSDECGCTDPYCQV